jgi:RNA polymerase sigma-70 factor (ECF subfamily)
MNNRELIEEIYRLYEQKMYYIAFSILNNEQFAEDAVQNAFVKLIQHVSRIHDVDSDRTKAYIIKIIKSSSIDIYRRRKRENELFDNEGIENASYQHDYDNSEPDLKKEMIQDKLLSLPDKYREIITLHVIDGISIRDIAATHGISYAAARKRYERGMKLLREEPDISKGE